MSFLSAFLLVGLPLALAPIIVHLLARQKKQVVDWGAMQFLVAAKQKSRRSWRVRDWILLLLRVLVLLLFIIALARPLVPVSWLGGHAARDAVFLIDHSMSTGFLEDGDSRYALQIAKLEEVWEDYDEGDFARVGLVNDRVEWLTAFPVKMNQGSKTEILELLRKREPSLGRMNASEAALEASALPAAKEGLPRWITVVADGFAPGWEPELKGRWSGVRKKLSPEDGAVVRVHLVGRNEVPNGPNLGLDSLKAGRSVVAVQEPVGFRLVVSNHGTAVSLPTVVRWSSGEEELGLSTVPALEPGVDTILEIEHAFSRTGVFEVTCQCEGSDLLPADNEETTLVEVVSGLPVLLVAGQLSSDPLQSETAYMVAALGGSEGERTFAPTVVGVEKAEELDLQDYLAVVLANTDALSPSFVRKLEAFVRDGGGLWIAPGDQTDTEWFNRTLFADGLFSPVSLQEKVGNEPRRDRFEQVTPPDDSHPATRLLGDTARLDLDRVRVFERFRFGDFSPGLSILLRLEEGDPVAVEHQLGRGRVLVQGMPLGVRWSNLPLLQVYVALVQEWLWYLVDPWLTRRNLAPGDLIEWTGLTEGSVEGRVTLPDGREEAVASSEEGTRDTGSARRRLRFDQTNLPGSYTLEIKQADGSVGTSVFRVVRDAGESDLGILDEGALTSLRSSGGLVFGEEKVEAKKEEEVKRRPFWPFLLLLLLLVLVGESLLALWISKGRHPQGGLRMKNA
ncbi:MAG: BatA domain-containing protein [Verrucomicrobiota bacterium]